MAIRNIIFDVGNVLVVWDPEAIERAALGEVAIRQAGYISPIRGHPIWLRLNRGELTFDEAKARYVEEGWEAHTIDRLFHELLALQHLKDETVALMSELDAAGYRLFAITDNVHEIVAHLKEVYEFWSYFETAAVSAEIGVLKPDPAIYRWLLDTAALDPSECVFFDDVPDNAAGAEAVGMQGRVFTDAAQARKDLRALGVGVAAVAQ